VLAGRTSTSHIGDFTQSPKRLGTVLADAGYWREGNATGEPSQRYDRLMATRNRHKQRQVERERGTSEGQLRSRASPRERMEERLQSEAGKKLYAKRT
jgi:hypothetical protein